MAVFKRGIPILIGIVLLILCVPGAMFALDVVAYIGEVGGTVTVMRSNPKEELAVEPGMLLEAGDTVKTVSDSYASIIFQDDGSRIKLGENSQLFLNATRDRNNLKKRMFLDSGGKLWAKVNKRKGTDLQIKTPTSVASVKGTGMYLEEKVGETWLFVTEGNVLFESEGGAVTVEEGQYARATREAIETGDIEDGMVPVEPGSHELIIFFEQQEEGTVFRKQLHIRYGE